ncbi:MAG TPA: glycosyl hydrolase family 28-related protein, partial [Gemmatimonadales bacterium]
MPNKVTAVGQYVRGLIDSRPFGIASVSEFGARNDGRTDCTAAFNSALESPARLIVVPPGFYRITAPLRIPSNTGKWMLGLGGAKSAAITVAMPSGNSHRAAIEYQHDADRRPNHAGCLLQNLHLLGNGSVCHGVHLQQASYPRLENVIIEGFDGAGLLIDKCQDGSFNNVAVVNCGRTRGNPADNRDTEYSALHLISTIAHDHCNMLRFRDCQIENNRVSPYVWIDDTGPIGIWFDRIHAENADAPGQRDFLRSQGGDCHFSGIAAVGFRDGFVLEGYGD